MTAFSDQSEFDDAEPISAGSDRLRRRTRRAFALIGLLLLVFLALGTVLQVAGAVTASGEVTVESSIKTISHPTGGVLLALSVREGDHVAKGQELMRFDTSVSSVGSASASLGVEQLLARRARLEAERDGASSVEFPSEIVASTDPATHELMARELRLFTLRHNDRTGALALLAERIRQYENQIRGLEAQIAAVTQQSKLIEPELTGLRSLYQRQLVTIERVNELERTAIQLQGSAAALGASIAETRAHISETREQMLNIDKSSRSEAGTQLADVVAQLNDQQVRRASAQDTFGRSVIRAPQSGTVDKLAYTTIGSAIPPAQPILQIVPDRDAMIVEGRVRPTDVEQLHKGQRARITFSGLDRQTTPDISGTLIFVSPDLAQDPHTGQSFYRIKVELDADQLAHAPQIVLKAGMPAEVFVQTGNRSILSYLIKPLMDQMRQAFREG